MGVQINNSKVAYGLQVTDGVQVSNLTTFFTTCDLLYKYKSDSLFARFAVVYNGVQKKQAV